MDEELPSGDRSWRRKFRNAFRGMKRGVRDESSFFAHFFVAAMVMVAAAALGADRVEWCLLWICIIGVLTTEMLNSALERMSKAIRTDYCPHLRDALDIAGGAVLVASVGAALIGAVILGRLALSAVGVHL